MKPTPRTDAILADDTGDSSLIRYLATLARTLEREIAELNERLIDRQQTLMAQAVKLQAATRILTRCRDSAGRVEIGLYEDIQNFLHTQP
jgi:hypothetical protein